MDIGNFIQEIAQQDNRTLTWVAFFAFITIIARMQWMMGRNHAADDRHRDKLLEQGNRFYAQLVSLQTANHNQMSSFLEETKQTRGILDEFRLELQATREARAKFFTQLSKDMAAHTGVIGDSTNVVRETKEAIDMTTNQLGEVKTQLMGINTALNTVVTSLEQMRANVEHVEDLKKQVEHLSTMVESIMDIVTAMSQSVEKPASDKTDEQAVEKGAQIGRTTNLSSSSDSSGDRVAETTRPEASEGTVQSE